MSVWDTYLARINATGENRRERTISLAKRRLASQLPDHPSFQLVQINGKEQGLAVLSTEDMHTKTICALPDEGFFIGDYISWQGLTWMVTDRLPEDPLYVKGEMAECNYSLRWIGTDGQAQELPCCSVDRTRYRTGIQRSERVILPDTQREILLPRTPETLAIGRDMRIIMDSNPYTKTPNCYIVANNNNIDYYHGKGNSLIALTLEETAFNPATDDPDAKLANGIDGLKPNPQAPDTGLVCEITYTGSATLHSYQKRFEAVFRSADGALDCIPMWSLTNPDGSETAYACITGMDGQGVCVKAQGGFSGVGRTVVLTAAAPGLDCTGSVTLKIE